jgi:hypothetical protein
MDCGTTAVSVPDIRQMQVYPNPCSGDEITLLLADVHTGIMMVDIIDVTGRLVQSSTALVNTDALRVKLEDSPHGVYLVRVRSTDRDLVYSGRFVR